MRIKKFFKRGARDNFVLLLTLLCEIHMAEFSRGRGTDLSHPLSSGLTHYILFIIRDYSKSTATLVYCSFKSPRRGFIDKINKIIWTSFQSLQSIDAQLKYALPQIFIKLHKYFHYFRSHRNFQLII